MTESQRKWLRELQKKGVRFEMDHSTDDWRIIKCAFSLQASEYRIPAQPIPDIPDWRKSCMEMFEKGVVFKFLWGSMWEDVEAKFNFTKERDRYQIPQQPIPEWREEMIESSALEDGYGLSPEAQKLKAELDKIPHRELQIQWHEDCLHHLKTGEPMREWEYMEISKSGKDIGWYILGEKPRWLDYHKYRRKPRMKKVTLWYCLGQNINDPTDFKAFCSIHSCLDLRYRVEAEECAPFGAVVENQVEIPEN